MSNLPSLYGIELEINNIMEYCEGEIDPAEEEKLEEYLEMLGNQEAEKIDRFGQFVKMQLARAEAVRNEGARLSRKAASIEERIRYLKAHYLAVLQTNKLKKVSGNAYTVSVRDSVSVDVYDAAALAGTDFAEVKTEISPYKKRIREAIQAGEKVPGCELVHKNWLMIS